MTKFDLKRFNEIIEHMRQSHIAVIGDLMIDRYVWGHVQRISPEAPVPVISLEAESANLGGAANVAANVGSLGAEVMIFGLSGQDSEDKLLRRLLREYNYSEAGIISDPNRHTTVKTRVIAKNQHLLRIDRESVSYITDEVATDLLTRFRNHSQNINAVILQDYNKGVLSPYLIKNIIAECNSLQIPVGVDPKLEHFWEYQGATLFKPNLRELESALGTPLHDEQELRERGLKVREKLQVEYLLVTAGAKGMYLFSADGVDHVPTKAHRVHDVSGAGDTVIATIMTALAAGATIQEAASLATYAASVVIAEIGAIPIDPDDLKRACLKRDQ